jgi:hypothetical protein
MLASEMLFLSFLLASSLCVLVNLQVAIRLRLLPMFSTLGFYHLLVVLANVLSTFPGF